MANDKIIDLTESVCWRIASKLDVKETPNWKTLISCMPRNTYSEKDILKFNMEILKPRGSPTLNLLVDLGKKRKTVSELITWITELKDFPEIVDLLERGEDVIKLSAPSIKTQPTSDVYEVGQDLDVGFEVRGEAPLKFQWFKGIIMLENHTRNNLYLTQARIEDSGFYICRVSNQYGYIFTEWIKLNICDVPYPEFNEPLIIMHPRSTVCQPGEDLQLYADAVGYPAPFLQWYRDDEPLLNQFSRELKVPNVVAGEHDGMYKLKASNKHGTAVSLVSQVTITKGERVEIMKNHIGRGNYTGDTGVSIMPPERPSEKVALLIGNEDYIYDNLGQLVHPVNDTYDVTAALLSIDFKVVSLINLDRAAMEKAVDFFLNLIDTGTYAVFYFAGHGFEIDGESYLMPIDATDKYKPSENYQVSNILKGMTDANRQAKLSLLLLDCCRTEPEYCRLDPIPKLRSASTQRKNVIIGYGCCSKGRVLESPMMRNGYFAQALVENITKDIKVDDVLFEVSRAIHQERIVDPATGRSQVVFRHSTVVDDIRLTQKTEADDSGHISQQSLLWQQAHIAPASPVKILQNEYGTVELIFTAQFSNCLLIQSNVKKNPNVSSYSIMFILPQTIGGANVEIISPDEKELKINDKIVRISNLERLQGDIDIHLQITFEENGVLRNQSAFYCIKEKPLYAKVIEKMDVLLKQ